MLGFGILRLLTKREALLRPIELRRDEQVHVHAFVVAPVDAVGELRVFLDARPRAAPERLVLGVEGLPDAWREREVVLRGANVRTDGADAVIQQEALVVVEVFRAAVPSRKDAGDSLSML